VSVYVTRDVTVTSDITTSGANYDTTLGEFMIADIIRSYRTEQRARSCNILVDYTAPPSGCIVHHDSDARDIRSDLSFSELDHRRRCTASARRISPTADSAT